MVTHNCGRLVHPGRHHPHGHQAALVPEALRVEDSADLANDLLPLEIRDAAQDLVLGKVEGQAEGLERPRHQRKSLLDHVE